MRRFLAALLVVFLAGCSPLYVLRAGYGELKILWRRQPIEKLLADESIDDATRRKLRLVLEARPFAEGLGMNVGGSYGSYSEVDQSQVVHLVIAARKLQLELYTWWFPIVGHVPYKGFFSAAAARRQAEALEKDGYDWIIRPSVAFSTLGWFDDPLLSTLLRHDEVTLVGIVLHELLHATFFAPSAVPFNESFASFAGGRGAIAFFEFARGADSPEAEAARAQWRDAKRFSVFLAELMQTLEAAYDRGIGLEERDEIFRAGKERFSRIDFETEEFSGFGETKWNNAVLLHRYTYFRDLDAFDAVYERNRGDLRATLGEIIALARDAADPFTALRVNANAPGRK